MTMTEVRKRALWIARFLATLGYRLPDYPINFRANNRRAILLTANSEFYLYTKYIKVQYYLIQEKVKSKKIAIICILTKNMVIDRLTKALNLKLFKAF